MQTIILLTAVFAFVAAAEDHVSKLENMNLDEIFADRNKLDAQMKCILDEGPCTEETKGFKELATEISKDGCANCSAKQKEVIQKSIAYFVEKEPQYLIRLIAKFEPGQKRDSKSGKHKKN